MTNKLNYVLIVVFSILFIRCAEREPKVFTDVVEAIDAANFQTEIDGRKVDLYTLKGENGIAMKVTNLGARVVALCVPDVNGNPVDVVEGYDNIDDYINMPENFFGAAVGRYGNRIANAKFTLDSVEYQLNNNDGVNHLHGGPKGYFDVVWNAEMVGASKIIFTYLSPDGEEGYPGNLDITMVYELTENNSLKIEYAATTDKATVCNLTHHSYFNLSGDGSETINDHILMINADAITPVNEALIPTGEIASVEGTPFDFRTPTAIGDRVNADDTQLKYGGGYDHNWVLNQLDGVNLICSVYSPVTKIQMDILTDQPGLQFYGGNFIDGTLTGKTGSKYQHRSAFCLETQHFPDSPNQANFPTTTLNQDETYKHVCEYRFSLNK